MLGPRIALLLAAYAALSGPPVLAQLLEGDILFDSELTLLERVESGAYRRYAITLTTNQTGTTLTATKDGAHTTVAVGQDDVLALWRELLAQDFDTLGAPAPHPMLPDQSHFTVRFRVKESAGGFSAYGVDSMSDGRYRAVIRAILKLADAQLSRRPLP
jgi:hypothetical protein